MGPALLGSGCIAGSVYGRDCEQLVHKRPSATYEAVEQALDNMRQSGTTSFEGGTPMPYAIRIDRIPDRQIVVTLFFSGQQAAAATIDFAPEERGKTTMISARIHGYRQVLRSALAGTSNARLGYAPDWALNLAARPLLAQLAGQIEQGDTVEIAPAMTQADAEEQWEQNLSDQQRDGLQQYNQYEATRPTVDPNTAAAAYMNGNTK